MQVANSYIVKGSNVTSNVVDGICQQLLLRSKKQIMGAMGKKELTQLRMLIVHDAAMHTELDSQALVAMVTILGALAESDNNSNDRKIFRCVLYLLMENLCMRNLDYKPDRLVGYKEAKTRLLEVLYHEVAHRSGTPKVLVLRLLGMAAGPTAAKALALTAADQLRAREVIAQVLVATQLPGPARVYGDASREYDTKILHILGSCSALRRLRRGVPASAMQALLNAMKINSKPILRHASALLLDCVTIQYEGYDHLVMLRLIREILHRQLDSSSTQRDDLALCHIIRAARLAFTTALRAADAKAVESAYELVNEVMLLIPSASLRSLGDIVALFFSAAEDWDLIVAKLEDRNANLVRQLVAALVHCANAIAPEDLRFPALCRLCERLGRFLWLRPTFGGERVHKVFSTLAVERDGAQLISLWRALSRYHSYMTAPKLLHACLPVAVKASLAAADPEAERRSYWAFEHAQPAQSGKSIASPYLFTCLLKAMVWVAPDRRYCGKDHAALWTRFLALLFAALEVLAASSTCAEALTGSVDLLIPELLQSLLRRVRLSLLVPQLPSQAQPQQPQVAVVVVHVYYAPQYVDALYALATVALRCTSSPAVANLLPQIWSLGLVLGEGTQDAEHRLHCGYALTGHLCDVVAMVEGAHKFARNPVKKEVFASLQEAAIWQLAHTVPFVLGVLLRRGSGSAATNCVAAMREFLAQAAPLGAAPTCDHAPLRLLDLSTGIAHCLQVHKLEQACKAGEQVQAGLLDLYEETDLTTELLQSLGTVLETVSILIGRRGAAPERASSLVAAAEQLLAQFIPAAPASGLARSQVAGLGRALQELEAGTCGPLAYHKLLALGPLNRDNCLLTDAPPPSAAALAFTDADFEVFEDKKPSPLVAEVPKEGARKGGTAAKAPASAKASVSASTPGPALERSQSASTIASRGDEPFSFDSLPTQDLTSMLAAGGVASQPVTVSEMDWDLLAPPAQLLVPQPSAFGAADDDFSLFAQPATGVREDASAPTSAKDDNDSFFSFSDAAVVESDPFGPLPAALAAPSLLAPPPVATRAAPQAKQALPAAADVGFSVFDQPAKPAAPSKTTVSPPVLAQGFQASKADVDLFSSLPAPAPVPASVSSPRPKASPALGFPDLNPFSAPPAPASQAAPAQGFQASAADLDLFSPSPAPNVSPVPASKPGPTQDWDFFGVPLAPAAASTSSKPAGVKASTGLLSITIASKPAESPALTAKAISLAPPKATAGQGAAKAKRQSVAHMQAAFGDDLTGLVSAPAPASVSRVPVDPFAAAPFAAPKPTAVPSDPFAAMPAPAPAGAPKDPFAAPQAFPAAATTVAARIKPAPADPFAPSDSAMGAWPAAGTSTWPSTPFAPTPAAFPFPGQASAQPFTATPAAFPFPGQASAQPFTATPAAFPLPGSARPSAGRPAPHNPFDDMR